MIDFEKIPKEAHNEIIKAVEVRDYDYLKRILKENNAAKNSCGGCGIGKVILGWWEYAIKEGIISEQIV